MSSDKLEDRIEQLEKDKELYQNELKDFMNIIKKQQEQIDFLLDKYLSISEYLYDFIFKTKNSTHRYICRQLLEKINPELYKEIGWVTD